MRQVGITEIICKRILQLKSQLLPTVQVFEGKNLHLPRNAPSKEFLSTAGKDGCTIILESLQLQSQRMLKFQRRKPVPKQKDLTQPCSSSGAAESMNLALWSHSKKIKISSPPLARQILPDLWVQVKVIHGVSVYLPSKVLQNQVFIPF